MAFSVSGGGFGGGGFKTAGSVMGAPLRFTPIGVAASAGRLGAGSGSGSGARIPLTPETHAALVQYHGPGSGGGAGMQGMDAAQEYSVQTAGVTRWRYAVAIVVLMVIFVVLPMLLLKMLGLL